MQSNALVSQLTSMQTHANSSQIIPNISKKPTLNPKLTPAQRYRITERRKWTSIKLHSVLG